MDMLQTYIKAYLNDHIVEEYRSKIRPVVVKISAKLLAFKIPNTKLQFKYLT